MKDSEGLLLVISGPAGAGKGTVVKMLTQDENIRLSISATTRAPRGTEQDGVEYHFMTKEGFEQLIGENGFIEYAKYVDNYYGTPRRPVEQWMSQGKDVILEIEVQGCEKVKSAIPGCISIFIMPPSLEELESRLRGRGTETEENIIKRMTRAKEEIPLSEGYDYVVTNDTVERCANEIKEIIKAEKVARA